MARRNLGLIPLAIEVAALGAHLKSLSLTRHVIEVIAGPLHAVTILLHQRDLEGDRVIIPRDTLIHSTGKKDSHREPSGAGMVGRRVIGMTTIAPGGEVLKIKATT